MSSGVTGLVAEYDLVIFDLDGVLYIGEQVVDGAVRAVSELRRNGVEMVFTTNNASRSGEAVADLLSSLGIAAKATEVVTSGQASAAVLADRLEAGSPVLVVGSLALADEVRAVGLAPVATTGERPVAVVQGYSRDVGWVDLAEASVAIRSGALWVATNTDRTLPSPRGPLPGNGALVAALATGLGRDPDMSVGKPGPLLFEKSVSERTTRPLAVGDRLDTDIEGAYRAGMESLLVFTGVSRPADLLVAPEHQRPTYVAWTLDGLFDPADAQRMGEPSDCGWTVTVDGGERGVLLAGAGTPLDALRALCAAWWNSGVPLGPVPTVQAGSDSARDALADLGLPVPL